MKILISILLVFMSFGSLFCQEKNETEPVWRERWQEKTWDDVSFGPNDTPKDEKIEVPAFYPNKNEGKLGYWTKDWQIWVTAESEGGLSHAPRVLRKYYRQKTGSKTAFLFYRMFSNRSRKVITVLQDGTVLLSSPHWRSPVLWIDTQGRAKEQTLVLDNEDCYFVLPGPEGCVVQPDKLAEHYAHLYYIPITNKTLDIESRIKLTEYPAYRDPHYKIVRKNQELAWVQGMKNQDPKNYQGSWLYLYDLKIQERRKCKINSPHDIVDFDDKLAITGGRSYNLITGEVLARENPSGIFAVHNGIGYCLQGRWWHGIAKEVTMVLVAVNPIRHREERRCLAILGKDLQHYGPPLHKEYFVFPTETGMVIWNGKEWKFIKWLETMPSPYPIEVCDKLKCIYNSALVYKEEDWNMNNKKDFPSSIAELSFQEKIKDVSGSRNAYNLLNDAFRSADFISNGKFTFRIIKDGEVKTIVDRYSVEPFDDLYFSMITKKTDGTLYADDPEAFAVCAFPADYDKTGGYTYIMNEKGDIYYRDTAQGKFVETWPEDLLKWTKASE